MKTFSAISFLVAIASLSGCGIQAGFPDQYKDKNPVIAPPITGRKIFVTQTKVTGNINGVSGADGVCSRDPLRPSDGAYRALLVDGRDRAAKTGAQRDWVMDGATQYIRPDGTPIGMTDANGWLKFPLTNSISATQALVWTGLAADWNTAEHCTSWSNPAVTGQGTQASSATAASFFGSAISCAGSYQLICVEQ